MFSTALDYFTGNKIYNAQNIFYRKIWLWVSVGINLGFLMFFKYYNFFVESFSVLLGGFSVHTNPWVLNIILPIGISFYTFHGLSYVFDLYNKRIEPAKNILDYSVFVSFFPLLVAGPIERASHLLPEFYEKRIFDYKKAVIGLRQILWGLFKKVVIADNCATIVDKVFVHYTSMPGTVLILGAVLFSIQIYADFSGYSDIALGIAKLFGFELLENFNFPYFSRNIAEFWRKWHISLTTWFRDYVYIPLGGSKVATWKRIRNVFIIFFISGFWHGANWTFIFWGLFHACLFIPLLISGTNRRYTNKQENPSPKFKDIYKIILTNILVITGWILFRSPTILDGISFIKDIFINFYKSPGQSLLIIKSPLFIGIFLLFWLEWKNRSSEFGLSFLSQKSKWNTKSLRFTLYFSICFLVILNLPNIAKSFIYFQF